MIRLAAIGGLPCSGKTSLIISLLSESADISRTGVIVNNDRSLGEIKRSFPEICCASFPLTAPCGRARQFSGTLEKFISSGDLDLVLTEPSGPCTETVAPLLNPLIAFRKEQVSVGPLFTVIDGRMLTEDGLNGRSTDGLRLRQQIDEADVVAVRGNIPLTHEGSFENIIHGVNADCEVMFMNPYCVKRIRELIESDAAYFRALNN